MVAIIDVSHVFHKSYFICRKNNESFSLENQRDKTILIRKVVADLMNSIGKLFHAPENVFFCFDSESWRKWLEPEYKANRAEKEVGLKDTLDEVYSILLSLSYKVFKADGAEADDCISFICYLFSDQQKIIISGDVDMHSLIDENTVVWNNNVQKPRIFLLNQDEFCYLNHPYEKILTEPKLVLFQKIALGCPTDNIAALIDKKGVGLKTIEKFYRKFVRMVEEPLIYALELERESAIFFKYSRVDFEERLTINVQLVDLTIDNLPAEIVQSMLDAYMKDILSIFRVPKYMFGEVFEN